mmetsp:Transcript_51910/g.110926  ORF Transcript_51910/g.110926 Transcript_51910/m.110926 type:complete len:272 (+) Transcript_51910:126-941(+)
MAEIVLTISSLGGKLCTIEAARSWSLCDVKLAVEAATGIPHDEQRLLLGNAERLDAEILGELALALPDSDEGADLVLVRTRFEVREAEHQQALDFMIAALEKESPEVQTSLDACQFWRSKEKGGVCAYVNQIEASDGLYEAARCFLAWEGDAPASHCLYRVGTLRREPGMARAFMGAVFTAKDQRRHGLATTVITTAMSAAFLDPRIASVDVLVDARSEPQKCLFSGLGFVPTKVKKVNGGIVLTAWRKDRSPSAASGKGADDAGDPEAEA